MDVAAANREITNMLSNVRAHLNHTLAPKETRVREAPNLSNLRSPGDVDWRLVQFVSIAVSEKMERDLGTTVAGGNRYDSGKFS